MKVVVCTVYQENVANILHLKFLCGPTNIYCILHIDNEQIFVQIFCFLLNLQSQKMIEVISTFQSFPDSRLKVILICAPLDQVILMR